MAGDRSDPQAWLATVELRCLCKEEAAEQWGVARWVCAQYSELGKFVIARVGLRVGGKRWLELRWLERISERGSPKVRVLPRRSRVVYGARSLLFLPLLLEDGLKSFLVWAIIRTMAIVFLMENAIPLSFLMLASAPAVTPASAAASPASAASPLTVVWWTRWVGDQTLCIGLWIGVFLGVFAVQAEYAPRVGVRGLSGIGPFLLAGLVCFCGLFLLRLLFHAHPEVIVRATVLLELFV
jgi:hypothetical protein